MSMVNIESTTIMCGMYIYTMVYHHHKKLKVFINQLESQSYPCFFGC